MSYLTARQVAANLKKAKDLNYAAKDFAGQRSTRVGNMELAATARAAREAKAAAKLATDEWRTYSDEATTGFAHVGVEPPTNQLPVPAWYAKHLTPAQMKALKA